MVNCHKKSNKNWQQRLSSVSFFLQDFSLACLPSLSVQLWLEKWKSLRQDMRIWTWVLTVVIWPDKMNKQTNQKARPEKHHSMCVWGRGAEVKSELSNISSLQELPVPCKIINDSIAPGTSRCTVYFLTSPDSAILTENVKAPDKQKECRPQIFSPWSTTLAY